VIVSIDRTTVSPVFVTVTHVVDSSAGGERQGNFEAVSVAIVSLHCPKDVVYPINHDRSALSECMTRQRGGSNDVV